MRFTIEKAKKKDIKKELPLVFINSIHFLNNSVWKSFITNTMKDYHDLYLKKLLFYYWLVGSKLSEKNP